MSNIALQRLLAPVMRGIRLLFGRGILTGVNDGLKAQNVQLTALDGETFDEVERPQQYGHISVPLPGAEVVFACLGGSRDQATVLVVEDRRYRPTGLPAGDSGLYHYEGHRLRLTRDGRCIITCKTLEVVAEQEAVFNTPTARFTDDVVIEKNLTVKQNMTIAGDAESQGAFSAPEAVIGGVKHSTHRHQKNGQGSLTGGPQ
ncbi:MAG: phage baseplate assembly protein V [Candidatus Symbiopectobacterium sp. Dall1.0]|nr:phage baseplate assembly protein V [Candidatus Symbiopectobacterium sp. Dall1.0]